jgi:predicted permease
VGRLVIVPAFALTVGILLGFRDVALVTLIAIFAAPCAVSSYTMAQQMDSDAELAGNTVIFSSLLSCFTMFMWIFMLKNFGLF